MVLASIAAPLSTIVVYYTPTVNSIRGKFVAWCVQIYWFLLNYLQVLLKRNIWLAASFVLPIWLVRLSSPPSLRYQPRLRACGGGGCEANNISETLQYIYKSFYTILSAVNCFIFSKNYSLFFIPVVFSFYHSANADVKLHTNKG